MIKVHNFQALIDDNYSLYPDEKSEKAPRRQSSAALRLQRDGQVSSSLNCSVQEFQSSYQDEQSVFYQDVMPLSPVGTAIPANSRHQSTDLQRKCDRHVPVHQTLSDIYTPDVNPPRRLILHFWFLQILKRSIGSTILCSQLPKIDRHMELWNINRAAIFNREPPK